MRYILISIGVTLLLLISVVLYILATFDANKYKPQIAKAVKDAANCEIVFEGDIKLNFFPWFSLNAKDVYIINPEGFAPDNMMSLKEISVGVKVLPLLKKHVEVSKIKIDTLQINYSVNNSGATNIDAIKNKLGSKSTVSPDSAQTQMAPDESRQEIESGQPALQPQEMPDWFKNLNVNKIEIVNLLLTYNDAKTNKFFKVGPVQLSTGKIKYNNPVEINIEGSLSGSKPAFNANLDIDLVLDLFFARYGLENIKLSISSGAKAEFIENKSKGHLALNGYFELQLEDRVMSLQDFNLKGSFDQAGMGAHTVDLNLAGLIFNIKQQSFKTEPALIKLDNINIKAIVTGEELFSDMKLAADISVEEFSPREFLHGIKPDLLKSLDSGVLKKSSGKFLAQFNNKKVSVSGLRLVFDDTVLTGTASADLGKAKPFIKLNADINSVNLDRYFAASNEQAKDAGGQKGQTSVSASGISSSGISSSGTSKGISDISLNLEQFPDLAAKINIGNLTVKNLQINKILLESSLSAGVLKINPSAELYGGKFAATVLVTGKPKVFEVKFTSSLTPVELSKLTGPFIKEPLPVNLPSKLSYTLSGGFSGKTFRFDSFSVNADKLAVSGNMSVNLADVKPYVKFSIKTNDVDTSVYLKKTNKTAAATVPQGGKSAVQEDKPLIIDLDTLPVTFEGDISVAALKHNNLKIENIYANMSFKDRKLSLAPLKGNIFKGSFNADIAVSEQISSLKLSLSNICVETVLAELLEAKDRFLTGRLNADLNLAASGLEVVKMLPTVNGKGSYNIKSPVLYGFGFDPSNPFKLGSTLFSKNAKTVLSDVTGEVTIKNGFVGMAKTNFSSKNISGDISGGFYLGSWGLDYTVNTRVSGILVPIKITGTFNKPKFSFDEQSFIDALIKEQLAQQAQKAGQQAKDAIQGQVEKLESDINKAADEFIKGLFK